MTNDGDLAYKLAHPKNKIYKTYRKSIRTSFRRENYTSFEIGVDIGGYITSKAIVDVVKQSTRSAIVEIKIHEGKTAR